MRRFLFGSGIVAGGVILAFLVMATAPLVIDMTLDPLDY